MARKRTALLPLWLLPVVALWPADAWADGRTTSTNVTVPSPAQIGLPVEITAQITNTVPGDQTYPTGTVAFTLDGSPIAVCTAVSLTTSGSEPGVGFARCSITPAAAGTLAIAASYSPGVGFLASSGSTQLTVITAATTTAVSIAPNPAATGQQVTLTGQVSYAGAVGGSPTGTVSFSLKGGSAISNCSTLPLASGSATCKTTFAQAGTYTIVAAYSGDSASTSSSGTASITVSAGASSVTLSYSGYLQVFQPLVVTASVAGSGASGPTGAVAFTVNGAPVTTCASVPLVSAKASCTLSCLQLGACTIGASYNGDSNNGPGSGSLPLTIGKAYAGPIIASDVVGGQASPPYYASQVVDVGAKFYQAAPAPPPTGTATFYDGATSLGTATLTTTNCTPAGQYACANWIVPFAPGAHSVTAVYGGDSNYQSSTTPSAAFTVQSTPTTPYITSVPAGPVPYGQPLTIGATFPPPTASALAPTGTVAFFDGAASLGAVPIDPNGHAEITSPSASFPQPSLGSHSFTAVYSGDGLYQQSTAGPLTVSVIPASVSLVLAGTAFQSGQPAAVAAIPVVTSPGNVTPTGTVDFKIGGVPIPGCAAVALQTGEAQCKIAQPQSPTISVAYSGDSDTQPASATITLGATATPGFYVESSSATPVLGATVTVDTRLFGPPGLPFPTGAVRFTEAGSPPLKTACDGSSSMPSFCNPSVGSDGHALLVLQGPNAPPLGSYSVTALYSGDATYQGASPFWPAPYATPNITVTADPTLIVVASPAAQIGQPLALNAAVIVPSPGIATVNGNINWTGAAGSVVASCRPTIQTKIAQCSATLPSLDTFRPTASYVPGDGNTAASSVTVQSLYAPASAKAFPGIYFTATPTALSYETPVTFSATLIGAPAISAPGGTMTFYDNGSPLGSAVPVTAGSASFTVASLAVGNHSITASYSGDGNYLASAGANNTASVLVTKALTRMDLYASPVPSQLQVHQPVTLKATVTILGSDDGSGNPKSPDVGTIDFTVGGAPVPGCTGIPLANGIAQCGTTFSQVSTYTVGANYSGGTNFSAISSSIQVKVNQEISGCTTAGCGFSISAFQTTLPYGAGVGIRALLTGTPTPTGTVTFSDGGSFLATVTIAADGAAPLSIPSGTILPLEVGSHSITAVYSGDANFLAATTGPLILTITRAATAVDVYLPAPQVDQPVKITAGVRVSMPGLATPSGTVDFSNAGSPITGCTGLALQPVASVNGMAYWPVVCTATFSQIAGVSITATYSGDAHTSASTSSPAALTVGKAVPGIYLAAYNATLPYGAGVGLRALMMGTPAPTGTVTFSDGATTLAAVAIGPDGSAPLTVPSGSIAALEPGSHSITAAYSGDANFQSASAAALALTITKAGTSISVYAPAPQINQPISLRAAVTVSAPGLATPSGTVDFTSAGTPIPGCSSLPLQASNVNGMPYWLALCNTSFSQLSGVSIAADYNGDGHTSSAASPVSSLTVGKAVPGFYTAVYNGTLPYGAGVGLQGLLLGSPLPTGTVTFSDDSVTLATVPVGSDGTAALAIPSGSLPPLEVGTHTIAAVYSGDASFQSATAAQLTVTITKADTAVSVYAPPPQVDQPLTLKAAVTVSSPGQASPTGTVDFTNSGAPIPGCTGLPLQTGLTNNGMSYWPAFCTTSFPKIAGISIAAAYNGDPHTSPGASPATPLTVGKAVAGIYAASTPAAPVFGVPVAVRALLLGAAGVPPPTGSVTFSENSATVGTAVIGSDGHASLSLPAGSLAAGQHLFTATWPGDASYAGPATASVSVLISKASTSTTLSASFGLPLTAAVSVMAPGAGSPTGAVQFFVNGTLAGTASVAGKNGTFTAILATGSFSGNVWAVYQGDANFAGSASTNVSVTPAAAVTIAGNHNPATAGQPVTFAINVTAPTGAAVPTGHVQIAADGVTLGTVALTAGAASFTATASALPVGSHTITAAYSGDSVYPAASATLVQVVAKSVVSLSLTASPSTTVYGQPVTLAAQLSASGTVQFCDSGAPIGSAPIVSGAATLTLSTLAAGSHSITAMWTGDAASSAATSIPLSLNIGKAQTATLLASTGMVLTASVAAMAPGAGTPTGSVKFLDAATGSVFASSTLTGGAASASQPATSDSILAVYAGDANFAGSISAPLAPLAATNAASFTSDTFAPDEIVTLFGTSLSTATASSTANPAPSLAGSTVAVTDSTGTRRAANLLFISPSQASIVMPSTIPDGPAVIAITNASGATFTAAITVSRVAPGLFTADGSGKGTPVGQTVRVHPDGSQDPPQDLTAGPIDLGAPGDSVYLLLYGTGIRHQTTATASFACTACTGVDLPLAFAGAQPTVAGLDQVNLLLPSSLQGPATLTLTVNGVASNTVTLMFGGAGSLATGALR